ncbi:predicted protein [Histoplasma capsulatum G186AR]|uniref:Peptidase S7 domain-containing protein n=1 Tax=Ajellomyces capsulatus (strain G186AR / H82 / ATCC MYA-2454 / RMSCC 2432) TaxID=447093 RepID=C0NHL1_AJECG|nr:uncharacterized protein HCBG_02833 [Histoplasma capsulatum G186AR]EEH09296.1 predicted protein [Histoplasma capsulatum G186AR]
MASLSASAERIAKKSSEESETSISSTASVIDASNPFRLGFPAPLPALPVGHSSCDEKFPVSYDDIIREVTSLLKRWDISWVSVVVVSRRASAIVSDKRPTIIITAQAVKDDSWYLFVKDTQEYLLKSSLDKVCVEIHDPDGLKIPAHFPIEPEHPIVSVWQKLQKDIITVLTPLCWYSLSVVRRGYDNNAQSNPVTIIITSKYPSELSHTKRTIQLRCQQYNLDRIEETGLTPDHAASLNVGLVSPSNFDANFKREIIENALDSVRRHVEELQEQQGTEYLNDKQERALSKLQASMDAVNLEAQALNNLNRATGTVWAGSGFRSSNGFGMDWALVSLPNSRSFLNKLPTSKGLAALPPYIHPTLLFPDSRKVEECGPCEKGAIVFKSGRTTGLTSGTLSHVDTTVNFNGRTVSAWHVIGINNVPFCDSGDSGSWLIDENGKWVGLLFACPFPSYTGDGYAIPALELIKDIEALVGGRVEIPID